MNINDTLVQWVEKSEICKAIITDEILNLLKKAFSNNESERYTYSISVFRRLWENSCFLGPMPYYENLAGLEYGSKYYDNYRDHTTHMLKVFFLGLYIYENSPNVQNAFCDDDKQTFIYSWMITALYHDIGYLFETLDGKVNDSYQCKIFELITKTLKRPLHSIFRDELDESVEEILIKKLKLYSSEISSMADIDKNDNIWKKLYDAGKKSGLKMNDEVNPIKEYYNFLGRNAKKRAYLDHGICSSLMLLVINNSINEYIKNISVEKIGAQILTSHQTELIKNSMAFNEERNLCVERAANAIALHNINKDWEDIDKKDLLTSGVNVVNFNIELMKLPYAYLLRLTDEIAYWDRQMFRLMTEEERRLIVSGDDMDIKIQNEQVQIVHNNPQIKSNIIASLKGIISPNMEEIVGFKDHIADLKEKEKRTKTKKRTEPASTKRDKPPIWLPDAETAEGEQTRFKTYTKTNGVQQIVNCESPFWGMASVKGIGKTFVLQVKRVKSSKSYFCVPYEENPGPSNHWATETLVIDNPSSFINIRFITIVLLWKYCIECRLINACIKYFTDLQFEDEKNELIQYINRKDGLNPQSKTYMIDEEYGKIGRIMKGMLNKGNISHNELAKEYYIVTAVTAKAAKMICEKADKKAIVLFLDKLDQSMRQPTSEPPIENCDLCYKQNGVNNCTNPYKSEEYCINQCLQKKYTCCYGCEKYMNQYSGFGSRVFNNVALCDLMLSHVNYWQYFQLALVEAAYQIKAEHSGKVRVYYAIRKEALNCDENVLQEQKKKYKSLLMSLCIARTSNNKFSLSV